MALFVVRPMAGPPRCAGIERRGPLILEAPVTALTLVAGAIVETGAARRPDGLEPRGSRAPSGAIALLPIVAPDGEAGLEAFATRPRAGALGGECGRSALPPRESSTDGMLRQSGATA